MFSARPQGKDFLRTALAEAGSDAAELQDFGDLKKLTKTELKGIAAQVLRYKKLASNRSTRFSDRRFTSCYIGGRTVITNTIY